MSAYDALAQNYDILTRDVPYEQTADYLQALFFKENARVKSVLDLACGTGTLTCLLAERGFDMIGADMSPEMLAVAAGKALDMENAPMFINQPMQSLDLYGTVDAAVCTLDGINHIEPEMLGEVLRRVLLFLEPGGLFVFDILTPGALRRMDGEIFIDESDGVYCVWRADFDDRQNACGYVTDLFTRDGSRWVRNTTEHTEYAYDPAGLETLLTKQGFCGVKYYGDMTFEAPPESARRIFFTARKPE